MQRLRSGRLTGHRRRAAPWLLAAACCLPTGAGADMPGMPVILPLEQQAGVVDAWTAARARAQDEGIEPSIYTHLIGCHGYGAGPTIGLWDQQHGVPGKGDYRLFPDTAHAIELATIVDVDGWGTLRIKLEEDAFFDGETVRYIDGRQTDLHLIPRP